MCAEALVVYRNSLLNSLAAVQQLKNKIELSSANHTIILLVSIIIIITIIIIIKKVGNARLGESD